LGKFSIW